MIGEISIVKKYSVLPLKIAAVTTDIEADHQICIKTLASAYVT
jgi:hypothetical protein